MSEKIANLAPNRDQLELFEKMAPDGAELKWIDSTQSIEDQAKELDGVTAVIVTPSEYSVELARLTPSVRLVQTVSAGTNMIDKLALGELGITVSNNGGGNAISVAEHTMGLLVSTVRKLQLQFNSVRAGTWTSDIRAKWYYQANEIAGKTVGIIGLGRIGHRVAKRLHGWECDVIYSDVITPPDEFLEGLDVTSVSLEELLRTSDIITLHVPLNASTHHMISDAEFDMMKSTAILINACRGPVVDEAALVRAMQDKKIAAAGLDVTEVEPTPPDNPLLEFDNVLITPHMASFAQEATERSRGFAIYNADRVAKGQEPESAVPPDGLA
ncbi:MAG: lactate dehydrogenase [Chloroflexi bacterium]|nr:lactate dehydrogenase [Chloroflexota bacterium]